MLVGGILMLAVGIATKILTKKLCAGVTNERAQNILRGAAPAVGAQEEAQQTPASDDAVPAAAEPAADEPTADSTESDSNRQL